MKSVCVVQMVYVEVAEGIGTYSLASSILSSFDYFAYLAHRPTHSFLFDLFSKSRLYNEPGLVQTLNSIASVFLVLEL